MKALANHVLRDHVLFGGVLAAAIFPAFGWTGALAFWASTVLIDLDDYLNFIVHAQFRVWDPESMFRFHEALFERRHRSEFLAVEIFHTLEFVALLGLAAFWKRGILVPIFLGVLVHFVIDLIHLARYGILHKRSISFFEYGWRVRRMRARGLDPDVIWRETLEGAGLR